MNLADLYKEIENPLNDINVIKQLINDYSRSFEGLGGFYDKLTTNVEKQYSRKYIKKDGDLFYSMMFNLWKKSVVEMSKERFIELRNNGSYDNDFIQMRNYLKTVKDVSTLEEVNKVLYENSDSQISEALNKYRWNAFSEDPVFQHVCSRYVSAKKDSYPNVMHRLYLNMELVDIYKFLPIFVEKCNEKDIPYYFKFDKLGTRDDSIVIYSDDENLINYINILTEIKSNEVYLASKMKNPPILTGKIDGFIGYGSEPVNEKSSFNKKRAKSIESIIDSETKKWIMKNQNLKICVQDKYMDFREYIGKIATTKFIKKLENNYQNRAKCSSFENANFECGYSKEELFLPAFQKRVYSLVQERINQDLTSFCQNKEFRNIEIELRNNKKISFTSSLLETTIRELAVQIANHDPEYISRIRRNIINDSMKIGVDPDKYCFDLSVKNKVIQIGNRKKSERKNRAEFELELMFEDENDKKIKSNMQNKHIT